MKKILLIAFAIAMAGLFHESRANAQSEPVGNCLLEAQAVAGCEGDSDILDEVLDTCTQCVAAATGSSTLFCGVTNIPCRLTSPCPENPCRVHIAPSRLGSP